MQFNLDKLILQNILLNPSYTTKVLPYIKDDYFQTREEKLIFETAKGYYSKYDVMPDISTMRILMVDNKKISDDVLNDAGEICDKLYKDVQSINSEEWLVNSTETFCRERAVFNTVSEAISIIDDKSKSRIGALPEMFQEALAVSFDVDIGHSFFGNASARYAYYHEPKYKVPIHLDIFNKITAGGVSKKTLNLILAGTNAGKAQPKDTLIPTPTGVVRFGDLVPGDIVYGSNGLPTTVTGVFDKGMREVFEFEFADGRKTEACAEHLWAVHYNNEPYKVIDTSEICARLAFGESLSIPLCQPVRMTMPDVNNFGCSASHRAEMLDDLIKPFPDELYSSARRVITSERTVNDIIYITRSLGGLASFQKLNDDSYEVEVSFPNTLHIKNVKSAGIKDCMCISVSADDHLYLTNDFIVTHNTMLMVDLAAGALMSGKNVLYVSLEMGEIMISERLDSNLMGIPPYKLVNLSENKYFDNISKIQKRTLGELYVKEYPTAGASVLDIEHLLNELKTKKNFIPDLIFVDYMNLMQSARVSPVKMNMATYYKMIAEELRGLAIKYNLPIWTAGQFNRGGYDNSDAGLEDMADSFSSAFTADFILGLIRTEELDQLGQVLIKQLKSRYSDMSRYKTFTIGVDLEKCRYYDLEDSAQPRQDKSFDDDTPVMDKSRFGDSKSNEIEW